MHLLGLPSSNPGGRQSLRSHKLNPAVGQSQRQLVRLLHILDVAAAPLSWQKHIPAPCLLLRRWPQRARSCVPDAASRINARQTSLCPPHTSRQSFSRDQRHMMGRGSLLTCSDIATNPGPHQVQEWLAPLCRARYADEFAFQSMCAPFPIFAAPVAFLLANGTPRTPGVSVDEWDALTTYPVSNLTAGSNGVVPFAQGLPSRRSG